MTEEKQEQQTQTLNPQTVVAMFFADAMTIVENSKISGSVAQRAELVGDLVQSMANVFGTLNLAHQRMEDRKLLLAQNQALGLIKNEESTKNAEE